MALNYTPAKPYSSNANFSSAQYGPVYVAPPKPTIPASGYGTQYASNPTNYKPASSNPTPTSSLPSNPNVNQVVDGMRWDGTAWQGANTSAASDEARRREEETRNAIEGGYSAYENNLKGLESDFTQSETEDIGSASKVYEQIFGGLTEQKTTNLDKLAAGRTAVDTRKAQSIKDLQQNLGNTMRAASMNFGAMGAGDTSATRVMLPYAYTKLAGAQEGSIAKQANDQQFDIDQEERDTNLQFSDMWRQTEIEKETQINGIKQYYGDAIRNVKSALAQAPLDKSRDLAALSQSLLAEAQSNLRQLEAEDRSRKEQVRTWATNRMSQLNDMKLSLANSAQFSPQDITFQELSAGGMIGPTTGVGSDGMYNPMALAQKKRQQYLG
jgi:hypothetical protein